VVFGMNREEDGSISLGGNIQYQYGDEPNDEAVDNVAVTDDQFGVIASGASIRRASPRPSRRTRPCSDDDERRDRDRQRRDAICTPGTDSLTVNVTAPPQARSPALRRSAS
jgi:hypothetical protein